MLHLETWVAQAKAVLVTAGLANMLENEDKPSRDDQPFPIAHVAIGEDNATPDGAANHMPVRFVHTTKLTVEVLDRGNNGRELKTKLVGHAKLVLDTLFNDLAWLLVSGATVAEGISGVTTEFDAPPEGATVDGRVLITISIQWKSRFVKPTAGLPALARIDVDAGNGLGARVPLAS